MPHTTVLEDQPMPDVISTQPSDVRLFVALDVHKFSIVAAVLPPAGGRPEVSRIETTEKAIRRLIQSLGWRGGSRGQLRSRARWVRFVAAVDVDRGGV